MLDEEPETFNLLVEHQLGPEVKGLGESGDEANAILLCCVFGDVSMRSSLTQRWDSWGNLPLAGKRSSRDVERPSWAAPLNWRSQHGPTPARPPVSTATVGSSGQRDPRGDGRREDLITA